MNLFKRIKWKLIEAIARRLPPCRVITHLLSERRDRKLSFREWTTLQTHLMVCTWCTRFGHQIASVEHALELAGNQPERLVGAEPGLTDSTRERIRRQLEQRR